MDKKKKDSLRIGFIGAGRIAHSLVPAFVKAGYNVNSAASRDLGSAWKLARKNGIRNFSNSPVSVAENCSLIFLSVPDSQIKTVAKELAKVKGKTIVHLSGTEDIGCLKILRNRGAFTAGLHLLQAFPERKQVKIKGSYASVEASDDKTSKLIYSIAEEIGLIPFRITGKEKILLHIMCVFAANFINADYYNARLLYGRIKSTIPPIEKLLYPLSNANLSNIHKNGIEKSLSGPIARKDYDTVNRHLEELFEMSRKEKVFKDVLDSYAIQTLNLLRMTGSKGLKK